MKKIIHVEVDVKSIDDLDKLIVMLLGSALDEAANVGCSDDIIYVLLRGVLSIIYFRYYSGDHHDSYDLFVDDVSSTFDKYCKRLRYAIRKCR